MYIHASNIFNSIVEQSNFFNENFNGQKIVTLIDVDQT